MIQYSLAFIFTVIAVITDIREYKIKNRYVLPFISAGLLINVILSGFTGLLDAVSGMLIPLILFPLFILRILGAGDIKAFSVIGSIAGLHMSIRTILLSFLAGGIIALVPYARFTEDKSRFRFALGICAGFVTAVILQYAGIRFLV